MRGSRRGTSGEVRGNLGSPTSYQKLWGSLTTSQQLTRNVSKSYCTSRRGVTFVSHGTTVNASIMLGLSHAWNTVVFKMIGRVNACVGSWELFRGLQVQCSGLVDIHLLLQLQFLLLLTAAAQVPKIISLVNFSIMLHTDPNRN